MKILVAETAGFCWGVRRALDQAVDLAKKTDGPVRTFGPLIHNAQVLEELTEQNIHAVEQLSDIRGGTVLVRAHGVRPEVFDHLRSTGAEVFDATCPLVRKVQKIISKYGNDGYDVVIVGDDHHAEVVGLRGYTPNRCFVVANEKEAEGLPEFERVCVVSQTTQNDETFARTVDVIKRKARVIRAANTVCEPTRDHQRETIDLARQVDLMVVVGGRHSANTCRLADLAAQEGPRVLHIETDAELQSSDFDGCAAVGITAGASTPEWMINRVVEKIEAFNPETTSRLTTLLKHALGVLVASNVYVGLGAAALTLATSLLLESILSQGMALLLMSMAGLFILAMHTVNRYQERSHYSGWGTFSPRAFQHFQRVMLWIGVGALSVSLGLAASIGLDQFLALAAFALLGALYGMKLVPLTWARYTLGIRRLKDLPASRDLGTALAWTVAAGIVPLRTVGSSSPLRAAGVLSFVFLLVFLRSALIGVRDVQGDKIMGMETIFKVVGKRRTKGVLLSVVATLIMLLLALTFPWHGLPLAGFLLTVVPYVCGVSWMYHHRLLPKGAAGEILVDGQFLLAGVMAFLWHSYQ
ncbi:MAG TPA: 4-hydroxy-3-methylbut-2-enyl diphosphate reductase [Candidatus Binatia bacterium]|jgi:4-hydroxy-3-methylbut-2-enyl diphosphate reductase|nr:4-hydroxy-3-methylbut-2-enyl diphosphate reductase [Candidatus Binatia bacterium]